MEATVVIPTHDHADTLLYSVRSALSQRVRDIEVFLVGDGVPDRTREIAAELRRRDRRVRFFDFPKGPRHGELNRHEALKEARGRCVCYLCDDDLWLPGHLEAVCAALEKRDWAHSVELVVPVDGELALANGFDIGRSADRRLLSESNAGVGLSGAAHTLDAYRRLPYGWRTTPAGVHTDVHMWRQFADQPWCRMLSLAAPGVLKFPAPHRLGWAPDRRAAELASWAARIRAPGFVERIGETLLSSIRCGATDGRDAAPWTPVPLREPFAECRVGELLDFRAGGSATRHLSWGWWQGESWGRWSVGSEARLTFRLDAVTMELVAECELQAFLGPDSPWLDVDVVANGVRVASWTFVSCGAMTTQSVPLSALLLRDGTLDLRFQIPGVAPACDRAATSDPRRLGIGVKSMRLVEWKEPE